LKLLDSLALPVYQVVPDSKLKIDGGPKEQENDEGVVAVEEEKAKEGRVGKKKGRIQEVRYMDNNNNNDNNVDGQVVDEVELGSDGEGDIDNDDDDDFEKVSEELLKKKRKKGDDKGKGEKKEQKVAKLKKEDGVKQKKVKNEDGIKQKKLKKGSLVSESGGMQVRGEKKKILAA
jgi:ribosome biogenesis protein UTP30